MSSPLDQKPRLHFPERPQFSGFMKPCRVEAEVPNLEVYGEIPEDIDGTFYRVMPDPQFAPFIDDDPVRYIRDFPARLRANADSRGLSGSMAMATSVHSDLRTGGLPSSSGSCGPRSSPASVRLSGRSWVRDRHSKSPVPTNADSMVLGKYRNKYTDAVEFKIRTTANTNIIHFNGRLLALKEDAPPYAMDPETLETHGLYTFDGQLPSLTFTAHPKFDPKTGEMICFGYEAKGDGTPDVCYYRIAPDGKFLETVWLTAPVVAMIHDFAVTENWVSDSIRTWKHGFRF